MPTARPPLLAARLSATVTRFEMTISRPTGTTMLWKPCFEIASLNEYRHGFVPADEADMTRNQWGNGRAPQLPGARRGRGRRVQAPRERAATVVRSRPCTHDHEVPPARSRSGQTFTHRSRRRNRRPTVCSWSSDAEVASHRPYGLRSAALNSSHDRRTATSSCQDRATQTWRHASNEARDGND